MQGARGHCSIKRRGFKVCVLMNVGGIYQKSSDRAMDNGNKPNFVTKTGKTQKNK